MIKILCKPFSYSVTPSLLSSSSHIQVQTETANFQDQGEDTIMSKETTAYEIEQHLTSNEP